MDVGGCPSCGGVDRVLQQEPGRADTDVTRQNLAFWSTRAG
jgi:hypothetical protein